MQTLEFTDALKRIIVGLKINELVGQMQTWMLGASNVQTTETEKSRFTELLFDSHAGYDRLSSLEETKKILDRVHASELYEPTRLQRMLYIATTAQTTQQVRSNQDLYSFFSTLRAFQRLETACIDLLEKEKIGKILPSRGIAEIELMDYDGKGIEPERLEVLAVTIRDLHTLLARFFEVEGDQLRFKYFDSGSGTKVGIECVKVVAESITSLLVQYWDKIFFHKFDAFGKGLDAATKGLTFIELVQEKVDKKVIPEETGKNLTHRVLTDLERLIGAGVTAPLTEVNVDQRARLLEMRDVKLLSDGKEASTTTDGETVRSPES